MTKRKPKKNKTKKITPKTPVVQTVQNTPPAEKIEKKDLHLKNTCKVSVIVPVYNTEKHLRQCLDSIVNQTLKDIEIICVDDGSTDSSLSILNEYAAKDKRVKVLTQKNLYAGVARNNGMKIAHGKYFVFWDSDDYFELDTLKAEFEECEKYNADICLCGAERFDDTTGKITKMPHMLAVPSDVKLPFNSSSVNDIFFVTSPAPWSKMFSSDFIRKTGLEFQPLKSANDLFFIFSALALAKKIVKVDKVFIHYRFGQTQNLQSKIAENPDVACNALSALKNRLKNEPYWNDIEMSFCDYAIDSINYNLNLLKQDKQAYQKLIKTVYDTYWHEFGLDSKMRNDLKKPMSYDSIVSLLRKEAYSFNKTKISIIVPVYNVEKYLPKCLDSLVNQTLKDIEIVCVDDGSTDNSLKILKKYATGDNRIKIVAKEKNEGSLLARKTGFENSVSPFVTFVDADDYLTSDACEKMLDLIVKRDVDILQFTVGVIDYSNDEKTKLWLENALKPKGIKLNGNKEILDAFFIKRNHTTNVWGKIYCRDVCIQAYKNVQLKNAYLGEDVYQQFLFGYFATSFESYLTEPLYWYQRGLGVSNSKKMSLDKFEDYCKMAFLVEDIRNFLKKQNSTNSYSEYIDAMAVRLSTDCCRHYKTRLDNKDLSEAEKILYKYWHNEVVIDSVLQKELDMSLKELAKDVLPVPIYIHENSAYSKGKIPLVSIIIPAYNSSDYLAECIESAQKQTLKNIEIICVNDGSFDNSLKIIEDFAAKDKRITVVSKKNGGLSSARNAGIKCVHGKYILFLDSDDMIKNDTAEKLSKYSEKNNLDLLFFDADSFFESKEMEAKNAVFNDYYHGSKEINEVLSGSELFVKLRENGDYRTSACMQLIRTERLIQNKIEFYEGILHEDNLFTFENILMAKRAAKRNWALYLRRVHEDSIMTTKVSFRNVYGYLKTYEGMMCFTQSHHFSEVVENNIKYLVLAIKKHVYNDFNSLSAEEKKKSSTLSLSEQLWFESAMGSKTELGVRQLFTNFTNQVALAARIDIKNIGTENSGVEIVESNVDKAEFKEPAYMVTPTGRGKVIENNKGALNFKVRAINSGSLTFFLRGIDLRGPDGKRIPAKVTYTSLRINGEEQLKAEQTVWHDIPFKFAKNVKDGDTFDVSITWKKAPPESFALAAPAATVTPPAPKTIVVEKPIGDKKLSDEIATLNKKVADLQNQLKLKDGENAKIKKEALENCERILNMVKTCSVPKVAQNKNDDATVQKLRKEITRIKSSHRYRIGSVITFIPGSIRRWFKRGKK